MLRLFLGIICQLKDTKKLYSISGFGILFLLQRDHKRPKMPAQTTVKNIELASPVFVYGQAKAVMPNPLNAETVFGCIEVMHYSALTLLDSVLLNVCGSTLVMLRSKARSNGVSLVDVLVNELNAASLTPQSVGGGWNDAALVDRIKVDNLFLVVVGERLSCVLRRHQHQGMN